MHLSVKYTLTGISVLSDLEQLIYDTEISLNVQKSAEI